MLEYKQKNSINLNKVDVYSYQKAIIEYASQNITNLSKERQNQFINWLSTEIADIAFNIKDLKLADQQPYYQIINYLSKPLDEIHEAEIKKVKH